MRYFPHRGPLLRALVRPLSVEIAPSVLLHHASEVAFTEDNDVMRRSVSGRGRDGFWSPPLRPLSRASRQSESLLASSSLLSQRH